MTNHEWLECSDPEQLLENLRGRASNRKLRLLAVAWASRVDEWLDSEREDIELAMRFADGQATTQEMDSARMRNIGRWNPVLYPVAFEAAQLVMRDAPFMQCSSQFDQQSTFNAAWDDFSRKEAIAQCDIVRDLFPYPSGGLHIDPACLVWNSGCVIKLAKRLYSECSFEGDMGILADALEEAGCVDSAIIDHCRTGQSHARGCWVIDLLLGKQ